MSRACEVFSRVQFPLRQIRRVLGPTARHQRQSPLAQFRRLRVPVEVGELLGGVPQDRRTLDVRREEFGHEVWTGAAPAAEKLSQRAEQRRVAGWLLARSGVAPGPSCQGGVIVQPQTRRQERRADQRLVRDPFFQPTGEQVHRRRLAAGKVESLQRLVANPGVRRLLPTGQPSRLRLLIRLDGRGRSRREQQVADRPDRFQPQALVALRSGDGCPHRERPARHEGAEPETPAAGGQHRSIVDWQPQLLRQHQRFARRFRLRVGEDVFVAAARRRRVTRPGLQRGEMEGARQVRRVERHHLPLQVAGTGSLTLFFKIIHGVTQRRRVAREPGDDGVPRVGRRRRLKVARLEVR